VKRIFTFFLILTLLAGCGLPFSEEKPQEEVEGELIIREDNTEFHVVMEMPDSMIPTVTTQKSTAEVLQILYEPLFRFDEQLRPLPCLAESWSVLSGAKQYYINLKKDILWHDGSTLTANDVVDTIASIQNGVGIYRNAVADIAQAEVVNRHKVLITLNRPVVNFIGQLGFPIIKRNTDEEQPPVGTGAYRFVEKQSGNRILLEPNPDWHGGDAGNKKIVVTGVRDAEAAVYAFHANEADIISSSMMDLRENSPRGEIAKQEYLSNKLTFLGMNHEHELLKLPEIRRALEYLIDRNEIIEKDMYGLGVPVDVPVVPQAWFYNRQTGMVEVQTDAQYLQELLTGQGWYLRDGFYYKDYGAYENRLSFRILVNKDNEEKVAIAKRIAQMLMTVGIDANIRAVGYEQYLGLIRDKSFTLFLGEIEMDWSMDPTSLVGSGRNYFSYASEAMDAVLEQMVRAESQEDLALQYDAFCRIFLEDMPFVPLFFRKEAILYAAELTGAGAPDFYGVYRDVEKWYFSQKINLGKEMEEGEQDEGHSQTSQRASE